MDLMWTKCQVSSTSLKQWPAILSLLTGSTQMIYRPALHLQWMIKTSIIAHEYEAQNKLK